MVKFIVAAAILYIGTLILTPFPHYLPPDFARGFLRNKASFFYSSGYFIGFYAHIATAPIGLFLGIVQLSRTIRRSRPAIHRQLGQCYVWIVLIGVAPGGLIMATRSYGGISSQLCFGLISVAMWITTFVAWRRAMLHRYRAHGQWMCRSYTLMCSAIMLRVFSYVISGLTIDHTLAYQISAWLSWVPAMLLLELFFWQVNRQALSATVN
ncbi:DUF2306 domain-containing protein [Stieleria marina]